MGTVLIIVAVTISLGIAYTIYTISTADVDEGQIEQEFDESKFVKPSGWKVGKLPADLKKAEKAEVKELKFSREGALGKELSSLGWENYARDEAISKGFR